MGEDAMGTLTLLRQRALGGFALKYHCFFGRDRETFLRGLEQTPMEKRQQIPSDCTLKNGERVHVSLDDQGISFFVAVYLESRTIVTPLITVPPRDSDYTIVTDFDKYRGLSVQIVSGLQE